MRRPTSAGAPCAVRASGAWAALALAAAVAWVALAGCDRVLGIRQPEARGFEHRAHAEKGIACVQCHRGITDAGEQGPLHLPSQQRCVSCHREPHNSAPCMDCHGERFTRERAADARRYLRFSHAEHAGPAAGQCVRCHSEVPHAGGQINASMATCLSCHEHAEQIDTRQCDACHVDLREEMPRPESHLVHDGDFGRRHGTVAASAGDLCTTCHTETTCAQCHGVTTAALPARMQFDSMRTGNLHRANFVARHGREATADQGLCATCHGDPFCRECHIERGIAPSGIGGLGRSPHPRGWVGASAGDNTHGSAARRDPVACASCHGGAGEALCVECHREGGIGGSPHPPGFDSELSRADAPCRSCHSL